MNRKLLRTMTALSASATVFAVLLLAGRPVAMPLPGGLLPDATLSGGPVAVLPAEAALLDDADLALPGDDADAGTEAAPAPSRHHGARRTRSVLALPYFSFAQGLRRSRS